MKYRTLGQGEPEVSIIGLGSMGTSECYGASDEAESIAVIHRAIELGVNFLDTADMYGSWTNEQLVGKGIAGRRDNVVVATRFGTMRDDQGGFLGVNGHPDYVSSASDASLERPGVDHIDLYCQNRVDPKVPIEETVGALDVTLTAEGLARINEAFPMDAAAGDRY